MYRIALDGPPGAGKSTLAKQIAKDLKIDYLDSGAIYRALTLFCLNKQIDFGNDKDIEEALMDFSLKLEGDRVFVGNVEVTKEIRMPYVSENVKFLASNSLVRNYVIQYCRNFANDKSVVMDGRDIGTEVFPETPYKFYIVADLDVRAKRRLDDLIKQGEDFSLEDIKSMIKEREHTEKTRALSPLKKHPDAIEINTSYSTVKELSRDIISKVHDLVFFDNKNAK